MVIGRCAGEHMINSPNPSELKFGKVFIHGQGNLAESIPPQVKLQSMFSTLKARPGYEHLAFDSFVRGAYFALLTSDQESLHPVMLCYQCTCCVHSYGARSTSLYQMAVDSQKKGHPLPDLVFNPAGCLTTLLIRKLGRRIGLVIDLLTMLQVIFGYTHPHPHGTSRTGTVT